MKKVVFGISNLNIGGAEKVLVDLVNRLKDDYEITIFTIYGDGHLELKLDNSIKLVSMFSKKRSEYSKIYQKLISFLFYFNITRKIIYNRYIRNKYDRKVAFLEGPITSLFGSEKNNIAWVHTDISKHYKNYNKYEKIYEKYEKIIFVSHDSLLNFNKVINVNTQKEVIYNYLDTSKIINDSKEKIKIDVSDGFLVVARLVAAKGLDRLIDVSKMLIDAKCEHKIYVVGDGEERLDLEEKIKKYHLENNFFLLGMVENPYPYIKNCKYFLLPSHYEGFGMTIIEAMVLNKKIIITETGAKEALVNYTSKLILKNNTKALFEGLKQVIDNKYHFDVNEKYSYSTDEIIKKVKDIL